MGETAIQAIQRLCFAAKGRGKYKNNSKTLQQR